MRRALVLSAALVLALALLPPAAADSADAGVEYHPTTVLVGLADGAPSALVHRLAGVGTVANTLTSVSVDVVSVPAGSVEVAVAAYERLPFVEFAEPNYVLHPADEPNDPRFPQQYALEHIDAVGGWARYDPDGTFTPTGGATLAIVDSGIDLTHPELAGKIVACRSWLTGLGTGLPTCQDTNGHGTHVSGIAAATTDNGIGIAGVAFDAEIMALQALTVVGFTADIVAAITYAADNGAGVANYSFGAPGSAQALQAAVEHAAGRGVLQVAAAGNDGDAGTVNFPAAYEQVVAVSSTDANDTLSSSSSYGPEIEVAAPGSAIVSTLPAGQYGSLSGTSMASPHVAGLGALLVSLGLDAAAAREAIAAGAETVDDGDADKYGQGRINVAGAIAYALDELL